MPRLGSRDLTGVKSAVVDWKPSLSTPTQIHITATESPASVLCLKPNVGTYFTTKRTIRRHVLICSMTRHDMPHLAITLPSIVLSQCHGV